MLIWVFRRGGHRFVRTCPVTCLIAHVHQFADQAFCSLRMSQCCPIAVHFRVKSKAMPKYGQVQWSHHRKEGRRSCSLSARPRPAAPRCAPSVMPAARHLSNASQVRISTPRHNTTAACDQSPTPSETVIWTIRRSRPCEVGRKPLTNVMTTICTKSTRARRASA